MNKRIIRSRRFLSSGLSRMVPGECAESCVLYCWRVDERMIRLWAVSCVPVVPSPSALTLMRPAQTKLGPHLSSIMPGGQSKAPFIWPGRAGQVQNNRRYGRHRAQAGRNATRQRSGSAACRPTPTRPCFSSHAGSLSGVAKVETRPVRAPHRHAGLNG